MEEENPMGKIRWHYSPERKVAILREHLIGFSPGKKIPLGKEKAALGFFPLNANTRARPHCKDYGQCREQIVQVACGRAPAAFLSAPNPTSESCPISAWATAADTPPLVQKSRGGCTFWRNGNGSAAKAQRDAAALVQGPSGSFAFDLFLR